MSVALLAGPQGGYCLEHMPWFEPLYQERIELADKGQAVVPDRPGWGVGFDPDAIWRFVGRAMALRHGVNAAKPPTVCRRNNPQPVKYLTSGSCSLPAGVPHGPYRRCG